MSKPADSSEKTGNSKKRIQLLRGMKDILPADQLYWQFLIKKAEELSSVYGFSKIDTPILEMTNLFKKSIGENTDIVDKEMYTFTDLSGELVTLRPEATASVMRAYIEHGMIDKPQPVKLYYLGPMFRHDRPQAGRYRQFTQYGVEVVGEQNSAVDAQVILLSHLFCQELGLKTSVQINSIGCPDCRAEYRKNLLAYYRRKKRYLCPHCQKRLGRNPLRLLDCKEEKCQEYKKEAPQILDWLCDGCRDHFMKVLEYLDELRIPYNLNSCLVRGLDYYTKTVFELYAEGEDGQQSAVCGGGRYDGLVELLGGRPTPGCGFSMGLERVITELKKQDIQPPLPPRPQIFLAQIGQQAKQKCFSLFENFRKEGILVAEMITKDSLKAQLEYADRLGVEYVLILGQKEFLEGTILLRDMKGGVQETIDLDKAVVEVKKRLKEIKKLK